MTIEEPASRENQRTPGRRYRVPVGVAGIVACAWLPSCGSGESDVTQTGALAPGSDRGVGAPGQRLTPAPIVFRSDRAQEGVGDLYLMAPDGSGVTRLTRGGDYFLPDWSPDGESIAFRRMVDSQFAEVGLVAPDGSLPLLLTEGESPNAVGRPVTWSPDGQRIAFASLRDGPGLRMSSIARSGGQRQQMLPNLELTGLVWSPAAPSRIAYTDYANQKTTDIWITDSEGSTPTNLTKGRVYSPAFPRWSPNGEQIALHGYALLPDGTIEGLTSHSDGSGAPAAEIFVIDVESGELTRLTYNTRDDLRPAWSPDGESLLITRASEDDYDLWLMPLAAPEQAQDLIDDADSPFEDKDADWDWGR